MVYRVVPARPQRIAVLSAVFALHAVFLALLLWHNARVPSPRVPTTIAVFSLAAERPSATKPPPPPTPPAEIAKTFKPITEISIPSENESGAVAGASSVCSTIATVLDGLLLDPAMLVALQAAPPETRSIAGAVMMWNEGWIPAALTADAPLWTVRVNIETTLRTVAEACLDEEIIGPRLLPIPEADGASTLFVVLGSGRWTWRQMMIAAPALLEVEQAPPPAPASQQ